MSRRGAARELIVLLNAFSPERRCSSPTPSRVVLLSVVATGVLFASEQFQWFWFNHHKGWTVLIAVAIFGVIFSTNLLWWLAALAFRLRFQFSVRSLLMLTVAFALPFSWLAGEMKKAREQARIVNEIRMVGNVSYDWEYRERNPSGQPREAAWLRNLLGQDFFGEVLQVGLYRTWDADAEVEHLKGLAALQSLALTVRM